MEGCCGKWRSLRVERVEKREEWLRKNSGFKMVEGEEVVEGG